LKKDMMRPFNDKKFLTPKLIHRDFFKYPSNIDHWMQTRPDKIMKLSETQGCYYFDIQPDNEGILLIGTKKACRKLTAWLTLLCQQQEELLMLEGNMEKDKKKLEKVEKQFESAVKCEFVISQDLIRYAIGKSGSNIQEAKKIPEILDIKINENSNPPTVQIIGHSEDAVEQARDLLEIVRRKIDVPERQMKHLIGVRGRRIDQIKRESGVRIIQSKVNYLESIRKGRQRSRKGVAIDIAAIERELEDQEEEVHGFDIEEDEMIATLIVVGTKDAVETALGSLSLKLIHLHETEEMNRTIRETRRKLTKYNPGGEYRRRERGEREGRDRRNDRNNNNQNPERGSANRRRERRRNRQGGGPKRDTDSASSANPSIEETGV